MILWRKTRLVKKYIKHNIEKEQLAPTFKSIRHYSKLDVEDEEDRYSIKPDDYAIDKSDFINENSATVFEAPSFDDDVRYRITEDESSLKKKIDEKLEYTWQEALFHIIDEKNIDEVELYKKSGITKQTFSKIRSDDKYHPDKDTAIRLCIGLELSLEDTLDLLGKAGFTLSKSIERDLVFRYFIENKEYDLYTIDCVLHKLKMKLLLKY